MKNLFSLKNKIAIVTGGNGQLGQQYCKTLVEYGAKVAVFDLNNSNINRYNGEHIIYLNVDITKRSEVEKGLKQVKEHFGIPQILINNAGIDFPPDSTIQGSNSFEDFPEHIFDKVMEVNVKGTWICCQVIGKEMVNNQTSGSIINISSIYGNLSPIHTIYEYKKRQGVEWFKPAAYSVSKSAILNLTRYLATYWAKKQIRVNTISPAGIYNDQDEEFLQEYKKHIPINRMAEPDEINGTIVFLASDASSYITGANIMVDGGWSAW